ncbi:maestro heat-like repeat-containing protein family member 7 [Vidua macroura]|uniref:maestro heat-like repeat-containing protein family member 7 n=1 Tax=Vidua macroura TaxID=187451 RepID=UPI0023A90EC4|nr:maestro heat-like repeat-containing protein family member 7 [Vidua macroura]
MPRSTSMKGREEEKGEEDKDDDKSPGAALAQQSEEVEGVQLLQAVEKLPEKKKRTHCYFRRNAQILLNFHKPTDPEDNTSMAPEDMANADFCKAEDCAMLDHGKCCAKIMESGTSRLKKWHTNSLQERKCKYLLEMKWRGEECMVPTIVRDIYQWLSSITDVSAEHKLDKTLQEMTLAQPHDVVVTLLRCAPSCDRVAVTMWRAIVSSHGTAEKVLPELLCVLEDWPLHSTSTSDKDDSDVFPLAATRALWEIIHLPERPEMLILYFPCLFVALLFQVFSSTEQMPVKVNAFWRQCQHKHFLPKNPNRFALMTMKALLCELEYEDVVPEVERECGWDTLLSTDTHHHTVGLLARAMLRTSQPLCYRIARCLFRLLRREEARWEVAAMAFLVEALPCLKLENWDKRILQLVQIYLFKECRPMRLLVLRCLMVLCKRPSMAESMQNLSESLTEVLKDEDREVVWMTLSVLNEMFLNRHLPITSSLALQLAEAFRPLFDNDDSHVQLVSIHLFEAVMQLVEEEGEWPLQDCVHQSLLPLFYHMYDENQFVAEASWETLIQATIFLKKWNLVQLLETEELWRFGECLLEEDRDRADGYLRQSVMYLQSPHKSMREAAIRLTAHQDMRKNFRFSIRISAASSVTADCDTIARHRFHDTLCLRPALGTGLGAAPARPCCCVGGSACRLRVRWSPRSVPEPCRGPGTRNVPPRQRGTAGTAGSGAPAAPGGGRGGKGLRDIRVDEEVETAAPLALERFRYGQDTGPKERLFTGSVILLE